MKYIITMLKVVQFPIEGPDDGPLVTIDGPLARVHSKDGEVLTMKAEHLIESAAVAEESVIQRPGPRAM